MIVVGGDLGQLVLEASRGIRRIVKVGLKAYLTTQYDVGLMSRALGRVEVLSEHARGDPTKSFEYFRNLEPLKEFLRKCRGRCEAMIVVFGASRGGTSLGLAAAIAAEGGASTTINLIVTESRDQLTGQGVDGVRRFIDEHREVFSGRMNVIFVNRRQGKDPEVDELMRRALKALALNYSRKARCWGDEPSKLLTHYGTLFVGVVRVPIEVRGRDILNVDVRWDGAQDSVGLLLGGGPRGVVWAYVVVAAPSSRIADEVVRVVEDRLKSMGVGVRWTRRIVHRGLKSTELLIFYPIDPEWLQQHPTLSPLARLVAPTIKPHEVVKAANTMIQEFVDEAVRLVDRGPIERGVIERLEARMNGVLNVIASCMMASEDPKVSDAISKVLEAYAGLCGELRKFLEELVALHERAARAKYGICELMRKLISAIIRGDEGSRAKIEEEVRRLRGEHEELVKRYEEVKGQVKALLEELPKLASLEDVLSGGGVHGGGGAKASLEG